MLKVMVVDDEEIVRSEIRHMIDWERHGYKLVAEARNGAEGLRLCEERNPDIIISDIKMPVMDGLGMTTGILKAHKNKKIILLTSFGDFDFAREAIKLGIHSYVLKHELNDDALLAELDKARRRLEEEQSIDVLARREQLRLYLKRILAPSGDERETVSPFSWQGRTGVLLLGLDRHSPTSPSPAGETAGQSTLIEALYAGPFREFEAEAVDLGGREYFVFFRIHELFSEKRAYEHAWALARRLQSAVGETCGLQATVAIGPVIGYGGDLPEAIRRTKALYARRLFHRSGAIMTESSVGQVRAGDWRKAAERKLKEIREDLGVEDYAGADGKQRELFTRLLASLQDAEFVRHCLHELVRSFNLCGRLMRGRPVVDPIEDLADLLELDNVYQIADWFSRLLKRLSVEADSKISPKIREVLHYIHHNYHRDISLNEVADRLGLSLIYTSQLFKKEVGIPFVAYVTRCRIEHARELLETGHYKVHEVSAMVGYQTVQYFCKTYKRVTGKNPGSR
jgi:DNA-binding NarL/FixJ family response regulator/AraC-like DNA-binding protein